MGVGCGTAVVVVFGPFVVAVLWLLVEAERAAEVVIGGDRRRERRNLRNSRFEKILLPN